MDIIFWVIFGLIVGLVANWIDPSPQQGGWLGSMILGIIGALVGGWLGNLIFGVTVTGFNLSSFIVAVVGSIIILWVARAFRREGVSR